DVAKSTDWDQIGTNFVAVRGVGYVAWYPIATEAANLSEGNSMFEALAHWKSREAGSKMHLRLTITRGSAVLPQILFGEVSCSILSFEQMGLGQHVEAEC